VCCILCVISLLTRRPFARSANVSTAFSTVFCTSFSQPLLQPTISSHRADVTCMSCHKLSTHIEFVKYVKIVFYYILILVRS
jgi:hypothetical protein